MVEALIPLPYGSATNTPRLIVLHAMGEFIDGDARDFHAVEYLRELGISAHAFVTPSGVVVRSRQDLEGAWHAKGYNTDSLGVEFLVPGLHTYESFLEAIREPYLTQEQYRAGIELVTRWLQLHVIERIETHSALDPGRKHDPGSGFPLAKFLDDVGWAA